ncbi:alpha/beta fold hydrolase [Natrialba asiatica]|uniref:alpha/beta fold hydrolase n=1 Tax=Natrialba asiatica TaxID=64602 RepID=UPI00373AF481
MLEVLTPPLREVGHEVYTPTLTGLGEREHLARFEINLETHIMDIVNMLEYNDLTDVVLLGHSYAGLVVTGVAERVPSGSVTSCIWMRWFQWMTSRFQHLNSIPQTSGKRWKQRQKIMLAAGLSPMTIRVGWVSRTRTQSGCGKKLYRIHCTRSDSK